MPKNKNETLCVEDLRHAEYYEILSYREKIYYWHIEISKQMQAVRQQEQTVQ